MNKIRSIQFKETVQGLVKDVMFSDQAIPGMDKKMAEIMKIEYDKEIEVIHSIAGKGRGSYCGD